MNKKEFKILACSKYSHLNLTRAQCVQKMLNDKDDPITKSLSPVLQRSLKRYVSNSMSFNIREDVEKLVEQGLTPTEARMKLLRERELCDSTKIGIINVTANKFK